MVSIIDDILDFVKTLTLVDFVFYFSIMILIILIVSLIYIVRNSEDDELLFNEEKSNEEENLDLASIAKEIDERPSNNIDLTAYQQEQEEKAIISYDELINHQKNYAINYKEENSNLGINIKEIDTNNISISTDKSEKSKQDHNFVLSYDKEEAFLATLKKLNELLN